MWFIFDFQENEYAYQCPSKELAQEMVAYCIDMGDPIERYRIEGPDDRDYVHN